MEAHPDLSMGALASPPIVKETPLLQHTPFTPNLLLPALLLDGWSQLDAEDKCFVSYKSA